MIDIKYLVLSVTLVIWCALHSFLISKSFLSFIGNKFENKIRFYRIAFNIFTLVHLFLFSSFLFLFKLNRFSSGLDIYNYFGDSLFLFLYFYFMPAQNIIMVVYFWDLIKLKIIQIIYLCLPEEPWILVAS